MANGTNVGNAYLQIVPTSQGIQGSITNLLNNEAGDAGTKAGGIMGKLMGSGAVKAIAGLGIGAAVAGVVKSSLAEGGALEQSLGGVEAIFGDSADKVKEYASKSWQSVGVSANEYMEGVTSFSAALINSMGGDTSKAADVANQAFIDMGDNANRFGTDMASIQNAYQGFAKQNYTMLDNLKLGYGGTKSEMERLLADAEKISGVEYNIDNLGDVYEAIHVIQEELNVTGTTANEAAVTLQGSAAAMKAAWKDVLGNMAIGESITQPLNNLATAAGAFIFNNLIPMVLNALSSLPGAAISIVANGIAQLATNLPTLLVQVWEALKNTVSNIGEAVASAWPVLKEAFINLFQRAVTAVQNIDWKGVGKKAITKIKDGWLALKEELPKLLKDIGGKALELFSNIDWLGLGKTVIGFIGKGISLLLTHVPQLLFSIGGKAIELFKNIDWLGLGKTVITFIGNGLIALITHIPSTLKSIGESSIELFKNIDWLGLGKSVINFIVNGIKSLITAIPNALKGIGSDAISAVKNIDWKSAGTAAINGIKGGITSIGSSITSALKGVINDAKNGAKDTATGSGFTTLGKYMIQGVQVGIKANSPSVVKAMDDTVRAALKSGRQTALVQSPSKLFRDELGKYLSLGVAEGIDDYAPEAEKAIDNMINNALVSPNLGLALNSNQGTLSTAYGSGTQEPTIIVNLDATIDGEKLKSKIAEYTIDRINTAQRNILIAHGV